MKVFRKVEHEVDFCVVGGGMAGLCAAVAAARNGAKVALMHDRPVLGGNASSECRVHITGADRHNRIRNMRETGILEEIRMDNLRLNPNRSFSIWDTILYEKIRYEPNIKPLLNCSCLDATTEGSSIRSIAGWQLTTETYHIVKAKIFADCSGEGILAPLTGAEHNIGRESRNDYGESIAPEQADGRTMGMTCLFQAREYDAPQPFEAPQWANRYESCDELPYGARGHKWFNMGYWWIELGGEDDSIHDAEELRDRLLKIVYGTWDHIKNRCPNREKARNWALEWVQFLPSRRESRRYVGAHVLTQNDIEAEGRFDDLVAYGGWTMDDHHPAGFNCVSAGVKPTVFHKAPSPYGIPYRSLYSRNVHNLMFAGRDASCTHSAMSSTRVMGTGCSMGQAVGVAASIAVRNGISPPGVGARIGEVQQQLLRDDAYLPWVRQEFPAVTRNAALTASRGDPEPVRDGINRPVGDELHAWICAPGDWIAYRFDKPSEIEQATVIVASALDKCVAMSLLQRDDQLTAPPDVMPKAFRLDFLQAGQWIQAVRVEDNHQRLAGFKIGRVCEGVRFCLEETRGAEKSRLYAFWIE
ncbi:MAG: FAD-dependent oxidoreductase [Verrucomicrobiota bacterium]